ncbi:hypothetical protein PoB_005915800 [Plakobranchus ocellatus]|uniref:Uncharacterized protein n=1 Tax=Plakobranchus ocellatus TaxID=259542 RepID=A0AAV4CMR5_9GAST|nr:hypothetical protein PoB_005915800 [Plakobranchus ocellatus]
MARRAIHAQENFDKAVHTQANFDGTENGTHKRTSTVRRATHALENFDGSENDTCKRDLTASRATHVQENFGGIESDANCIFFFIASRTTVHVNVLLSWNRTCSQDGLGLLGPSSGQYAMAGLEPAIEGPLQIIGRVLPSTVQPKALKVWI